MEQYGLITSGGDPRDLEAVAESMWRLGIGGGSGSGSSGGGVAPYPERPGEPDCAYYMRTGACSYGERCRYNHPLDREGLVVVAARLGSEEYPERFGQPFCEYYIKTGTCKFGSSCKYHHPRQGGGSVWPVSLNYYGYPLRPGEKECSYFMKTGQCKFSSTCKFHHPQPTSSSVPSPAPVFYQTVQSPSIATPQQYPQVGGWQVGRSSSAFPGTYMPSSYGPVVLSPGVLPVPGWSPYPASLSLAISPGSQQSAQVGPFYGPSTQLSPSATAYLDPYHPETSTVGPSSSTQKGHILPQRPGQSDCQFYMRTGDCKFGAICKYHHPLDWSTTITNSILSSLGLPLRPGAQLCAYYAQHGVCKFGPTCKFDHPIETLDCSPAICPLVGMPVASYPTGVSQPTLAPYPSMELRPDFLPRKDPFSTEPGGRFLCHSVIQSSSQMSTASSVSTKGQSSEPSSST